MLHFIDGLFVDDISQFYKAELFEGGGHVKNIG